MSAASCNRLDPCQPSNSDNDSPEALAAWEETNRFLENSWQRLEARMAKAASTPYGTVNRAPPPYATPTGVTSMASVMSTPYLETETTSERTTIITDPASRSLNNVLSPDRTIRFHSSANWHTWTGPHGSAKHLSLTFYMSLEKIRDQLILISNLIRSKPLYLSRNNNPTIKTQHRFHNWWGMKGSVPGQPEVNTGKPPDLINRQILHSAMKHIEDHQHDFKQALSWSSAHTVLPSISSPKFPLPSISMASGHLNGFRASQSLPSNIASKPHHFQATASAATSLPSDTSTLLVLQQFQSVASKGNIIGSDRWSKAWYKASDYVSDKMGKQWVMSSLPPRSGATQDSCTWTSLLSWIQWHDALGFPKKKAF